MGKKMILAILEDADSKAVSHALHDAGIPWTLIDSTGGFLRQGRSTLLAGVDEEDLDSVLSIITSQSKPSVNPFRKKATIMVLAVDYFEQIP